MTKSSTRPIQLTREFYHESSEVDVVFLGTIAIVIENELRQLWNVVP